MKTNKSIQKTSETSLNRLLKESFAALENGATCRGRTDDLMITNQLLNQLSAGGGLKVA